MILLSYIIAHRANGSKYKENTKEAVLEVLKQDYVDGIEIDIHMTQDKKFVLSHNEFILCQNKSVRRITKEKYANLKKCKNIDLLEDVLKSIKTDKFIVLDLKVEKGQYKDFRKLIKLLKKYPNQYYLVSFSYDFIFFLKQQFPTYKMGYLKGYILNLEKEKRNLDVCFCYVHQYMNEEGIWTVNSKEEMDKCKEKNIFIITDKPEYSI